MKITLDLNLKLVVRWILGVLLIWRRSRNWPTCRISTAACWLTIAAAGLFSARHGNVPAVAGTALRADAARQNSAPVSPDLGDHPVFDFRPGHRLRVGKRAGISCGCLDLSLLGLGSESELVKVMKSGDVRFLSRFAADRRSHLFLRQETKAATATVR